MADLSKQKAKPHVVVKPIVYDAGGKNKTHPLSGKLVKPGDDLPTPITFEYLSDAEYEMVLSSRAVKVGK